MNNKFYFKGEIKSIGLVDKESSNDTKIYMKVEVFSFYPGKNLMIHRIRTKNVGAR